MRTNGTIWVTVCCWLLTCCTSLRAHEVDHYEVTEAAKLVDLGDY